MSVLCRSQPPIATTKKPIKEALLRSPPAQLQTAIMSQWPMILIPEAQRIALEKTRVLGTEKVSVADALGRVLAQAVTAPDALPPFPASIKDGYAVIAADGVGEFPVIGESRAGLMDDINLTRGHVAYITTGAPVPPGADAVIQVEDTAKVEGDGPRRVRILKAAMPGQDIRRVGSDIQQGAVVLQAGERVGVAEVGILATVGAVQDLEVYRRPHVAVLSTGDEVVEPSTRVLGPGQIRDANRSMLLAAASQAGCKVTDLGVARDTEGHLAGALQAAIDKGVDMLVTSGGVSMGDRDLIKPLLERHGVIHFGRVLMKPGKPLTFATLEVEGGRQLLVFGLPGNPVSSFVCFNLVALPVLRKMAGWAQPALRRISVRLTTSLKLDHERPEYHRATLQYSKCPVQGIEGVDAEEYEWWAVSTGNQISSRLLSARSANAVLEIPRASGTLAAGTRVSALLIDDLAHMPEPVPGVPTTPGFQ